MAAHDCARYRCLSPLTLAHLICGVEHGEHCFNVGLAEEVLNFLGLLLLELLDKEGVRVLRATKNRNIIGYTYI